MNHLDELVASTLPVLLICWPGLLAVFAVLSSLAQREGRPATKFSAWPDAWPQGVVGLYAALALLLALWPSWVSGHPGLQAWSIEWVPALGVELGWHLTPAWSFVLAVSAGAWWSSVRGASPSLVVASSLMQFGLGCCVAAAGTLTAMLGLACAGIGALMATLGGRATTGRSCAQYARRGAVVLAVAMAAGVCLCVSVAMMTHIATHEQWRYLFVDLRQYVYPAGVQAQNLILSLVMIAPFAGLLPFGGALSGLSFVMPRASGEHWRIVAPLSAMAIWMKCCEVLAPRVGAHWAYCLIAAFLVSACLRSLALPRHEVEPRDQADLPDALGRALGPNDREVSTEALVIAIVPAALSAALCVTDTPWGAHAIWLSALGIVALVYLSSAQGPTALLLRHGAPGSLGFAAWAACALAMLGSVATLGQTQAWSLIAASSLPALLALRWAAPLVGSKQLNQTGVCMVQKPPRLARLAMFFSLALGVFPGVCANFFAPHEQLRAQEYALRRCGDHELRDLFRPRLRSELRLGCASPSLELLRAFVERTGLEPAGEQARRLAEAASSSTIDPGPSAPGTASDIEAAPAPDDAPSSSMPEAP